MSRIAPTKPTPFMWRRLLPVMLLAGISSLVVGGRFVLSQRTHPLTGRVIGGIATDAAWLDRADREREEAPDRALQLVGITSGMTVADVGAGSGYMTMRIAKLVGPAGKVYANDLQPAMLRLIVEKAHQQHLTN